MPKPNDHRNEIGRDPFLKSTIHFLAFSTQTHGDIVVAFVFRKTDRGNGKATELRTSPAVKSPEPLQVFEPLPSPCGDTDEPRLTDAQCPAKSDTRDSDVFFRIHRKWKTPRNRCCEPFVPKPALQNRAAMKSRSQPESISRQIPSHILGTYC